MASGASAFVINENVSRLDQFRLRDFLFTAHFVSLAPLLATFMAFVPDFSKRAVLREKMDDYSIADHRLAQALRELSYVNRYLGGLRAIRRELLPILRRRRGGSLNVLDIGTGLADIPQHIVRWGERYSVQVTVTAVDANPATVGFAKNALDANLTADLRDRIKVRTGDVFKLDSTYGNGFDVATASLFLHHFYADDLLRVLREMRRIASVGLVINDLHRHPLPYAAICGIAKLMPVSDMFVHDGPASVLRGFTPAELHELAVAAGLRRFCVRRSWPYRLTLSTLAP